MNASLFRLPLLLLAFSPSAWSAPASRLLDVSSSEVRSGKYFWVALGGVTSVRLGQMKGFKMTAGWQMGTLFAADLRLTSASTSYKAISVLPEYDPYGSSGAGYASFEDPDSEVNRSRGVDDSWSLFFIEPGVSVHSHLFIDSVPLLSERVRFGIAKGNLKDNTHGLSFSGYFPSFEAALQYSFGRQSPWSAEGAFNLMSGHASSNEQPANQGLLPLSWVSLSVSLVYWF